MLVGCILLNRTHVRQVNPIIDELFEKFGSPVKMMMAEDAELVEILRPLGFYNRRAKSLKRFSEDYVKKGTDNVNLLYGIGKYAADSWSIFQEGRKDVVPEDKELKWYMEEVVRGKRHDL
jgi:methyl-CpG-binding domain protein 4